MSEQRTIPTSLGLPIIGNFLKYQKDRLALLTSLQGELGDSFKIKIGPKILTVLSTPEDVKHVMRLNMKNYYKRTNFDQLFGKGVFTTNNEEWKVQRKMVQPLFGPRYIESCVPIIVEKTQNEITKTSSNKEIDVYDLYAKITFEIIIATIIGIDLSEEFEKLNYSLNTISDYLTKTNYLPFQLPEAVNSKKKEYAKCTEYLNKVIYKSIEVQKSKERRKNFSMISLMLQAQEECEDMKFDDQRVRDNIISLMFAGFETSALTLAWLSCLLGEHQEVQEKLYEEIKDFDVTDVKIKDLDKLPYLDAVINETMRLYPAGWAWTRVAAENDEINGLKIEAGEIVLVSPYLTQRSPEVWNNPNSFNPDRFIESDNHIKRQFSFFPFGGGPRICVGKQFGQIEIKLILIHTLQQFKFLKGNMPTPYPMATLQSKEGFHLKLKARR
ncbi:MAG: hypothetical protein CME64_09665 [Halobacteriovoraceae bacterium]|nr:hypothetical protein [Halobacteriovoraceae bacterium]|tara:strand:- start:22641 stop:23963 length:1323 start_codon:yes stop_codon:yes gene_type:complete